MLKKIIVANWKMNGDLSQIRALLTEFKHFLNSDPAIHTVIICPPFIYASFVIGRLAELDWELGGQDCSNNTEGAFTGDISARMLKDIDCRYVLIGHSERRQHHLEDNTLVCTKMKRTFEVGITPILCVGETAEQRMAGKTLSVIEQQIFESIPFEISTLNSTDQQAPALSNTSSNNLRPPLFMIAYEPIWAIGTGQVATLSDIQTVHHHIRTLLIQKNQAFAEVPILYGGSVNSQNIQEIIAHDAIQGVLVGGASLKAHDFIKIITRNGCDL